MTDRLETSYFSLALGQGNLA